MCLRVILLSYSPLFRERAESNTYTKSAAIKDSLNPFQLTRSISTSGNAVVAEGGVGVGGVVGGGPGSPYHRSVSTAGSLNGLTSAFSSRPNLNKELMQGWLVSSLECQCFGIHFLK